MRLSRQFCFSMLMFLALTLPGQAGTLVLYPFSTDLNPTVTGPGITPNLMVSILSQAYVGDDGFGNVFEAYPTSGSTSASLALANDSYFDLSLTTSTGSLGKLLVSFDVAKGGASDPRGYFVESSLDDFTTDLISQTLPSGANQAPAPESFVVDATGQSSLSLRFYVWTPDYQTYSIDFRNLEVGTTTPEPATWCPIGFGLLAAAIMRRRRSAKAAL